jgi:hypothetical protein
MALLLTAGCGSGSEVSDGARVSVYVSQPLCAEAQKELTKHGGEADGVKVRVVCLPDAERAEGRLDLARVGADARRATEDSTTVAFVEPPGREAGFSEPILKEAQIALFATGSGAKAMRRVIAALESRSDGESPREVVWSHP